MSNRYEIHVESMCFTDKLGTSFQLPYSDKLHDAILIINEECSKEVSRREKQELDEFVARKYSELRVEQEINNSKRIREIMTEIACYYKKNK